MENSVEMPPKLEINIPFYLAILLWDVVSKEKKSTYSKDTCTPMVTVALSMVAKRSNQFRYQPRMNEIKMTPHIGIK